MTAASQYMPALYELKSQLADRSNRLRRLMTFASTSGLLNRVCGPPCILLPSADVLSGLTIKSETITTERGEDAGCDGIVGSSRSADGVCSHPSDPRRLMLIV